MAGQILDELKKLNPEEAGKYDERYRMFKEEIGKTDTMVREILEQSKGKKVVTYHPSLTYFCNDYGMIQLSVEKGGKEPTPGQMAELADQAKAEGIGVIYIQSEFDREMATVFAEEIGGKVIQIWPLNPDWSANLIEIAALISEN
jgi:zinc transport system substrate-binding protein